MTQSARKLSASDQARAALRSRLRDEALADIPAFDADLHQRVVMTLRAKGLQEASLEFGPSRWRVVARIAVGGAIAAAVGFAAWNVFHPPVVSKPEAPSQELVVLPDFVPHTFITPVRNALDLPTADDWKRGKYGYLDQDAQRFATFVANQIPSFPVQEPR